MYKVLGGDQQEYGPATAEELRQWIADDRLSPQSQARLEADLDWRPLGDFGEFAEDFRQQRARHNPPPLSAPPPFAASAPASFDTAATDFSVTHTLSMGWGLLLSNFGLIFGATFLVWVIGFICQILPLGIFYWLIRGVLFGGLFLLILQRIRGEETSITEVFSGFKFAFRQLMLAGVVTSFLSWLGLFVCVLPGVFLFVAWVFTVPLVADKRLNFWPAMELSRRAVSRVWPKVFAVMLIAFLPYIIIEAYLQVKISLALYPVMQSMAGGAYDFNKLLQAVNQVATDSVPLMLTAKVALLFNLPFGLCALMCVYENLFGSRRTPSA
jgi:hypothetical protein